MTSLRYVRKVTKCVFTQQAKRLRFLARIAYHVFILLLEYKPSKVFYWCNEKAFVWWFDDGTVIPFGCQPEPMQPCNGTYPPPNKQRKQTYLTLGHSFTLPLLRFYSLRASSWCLAAWTRWVCPEREVVSRVSNPHLHHEVEDVCILDQRTYLKGIICNSCCSA